MQDANGKEWTLGLTKELVIVIPKMSRKDCDKLLSTSSILNSLPTSDGKRWVTRLPDPDGNEWKVG